MIFQKRRNKNLTEYGEQDKETVIGKYKNRNEAILISSTYFIMGVLWILLSDRLLAYILIDSENYMHFQTYKGWFYIFATTFMLYILVKKRMIMLKSEINNKTIAYHKLSAVHNELVTLEGELTKQRNLTDSIIQEAPVIIVTHDENNLISLNPYALKLIGYTKQELQQGSWMELLIPKEFWEESQAVLREIRDTKQSLNYEIPLLSKDGTLINILWNSNLLNNSSANSAFVSFGSDITERKHYEEMVKHLAYYDALTDLPNRAMFELEINEHINQNDGGSQFVIVIIDIDNFKSINDFAGHHAGDMFLKNVAECLKSEVTEPDVIARLGSDEFAILYNSITKEELLYRIKNIRDKIINSWTIENHQYYISLSVGAVIYPNDGQTSSELLKHADIAMYAAKKEGKNRIIFFSNEITNINATHLTMINQLQYAIDGEQFELYYQPQYHLATGKISGMEALIRWVHPKEGFISPGVFIPVAEESGQIYKLERWIITKALEQKKKWEEEGYNDLIMSINLSGKTLTSTINFNELEQIFGKFHVDFNNIVIEITETANILDVEVVINHLKRLKMKGIKIALDDFGTGYSSLNYLKKFPINIIKLDKSFIDSINEDGIDTLLIKNILTLAKDLEFEVIAEGIETNEQLEFLKEHLCDFGQGYLLSKPLPRKSTETLLKQLFN